MPFTFAHPLYAYPLKYINPKYFSITGLVLGSVAPDFEYFIMLEPYSWIGHSMAGLFIEAIPLCILLAFIFHYIVKEALVIHLPSLWHLDQRAFNIRGTWHLRGLRAWLIYLISVVIGFLTHIFIDAFTHVSGYFVVRFAMLRDVVIFNLPVYKILQHSFSLLGLAVIGCVILRSIYKSHPHAKEMPRATKNQKLQYWFTALMIAMAITCAKVLLTSSPNWLGILVVTPLSGFGVGLIVASIRSKFIRSIRE